MMDKYNLAGSIFSGPVAAGDHNVQHVGSVKTSNVHINAHGDLSPELADLLTRLRTEIARHEEIDENEKRRLDEAVVIVAEEESRPESRRDTGKLARAWERIMDVARDLTSLLDIARPIAGLVRQRQ